MESHSSLMTDRKPLTLCSPSFPLTFLSRINTFYISPDENYCQAPSFVAISHKMWHVAHMFRLKLPALVCSHHSSEIEQGEWEYINWMMEMERGKCACGKLIDQGNSLISFLIEIACVCVRERWAISRAPAVFSIISLKDRRVTDVWPEKKTAFYCKWMRSDQETDSL